MPEIHQTDAEVSAHVESFKSATIRIRTCIATREHQPDTALLRVVEDRDNPGVILPDPNRRMQGRGAWLTPSIAALDLAEQRRAFGRALRVSTKVDTGHVRTYLAGTAAGPDIYKED
ncbi:YlxR family protein [Corynebacterium callunae]|uniref:YlxR family protein n=1 Tax=Corynebacterium callunae TaxID=1721 RepID=UPI001FFF9D85|nr:YlxR family protein [Corynebacterium callunae]MCK2200421.1 YlxR family protein [Corynebacterium callunae]